ncbi:MAG: sugar phosphate isomerase/epimerase [Clostridia bacterium]|nr:sugar phosphate isomerase/epimerase [Clostridia bacterium]
MRKISVSGYGYIDRLPIERSFDLLARAGVDAVDFPLYQYPHSMECRFPFVGECEDRCAAVKSAAERAGLVIGQTHAPFCYYEECSRENIVRALIDSVYATKRLGADCIVMHPVKFGGCIRDERREECFEVNLEIFREVAPALRETGVKGLLENMFIKRVEDGYKRLYPTIYSTGEELARAVDILGDDFGVCLDTGHAHITGEDIPRMVRLLGGRLLALHIHDNTGARDDHLPPYAGDIPFADVMTALAEVGYRGNINFEVNFGNVPEEHLLSGFRYLAEVGRAFRSAVDGEKK